jgi:hypothetical protein
MTHTEDNCAIYHCEMMPEVLEASENLEALGKELNSSFTTLPGAHPNTLLLFCLKLIPYLQYLDTFSRFLCRKRST